MNLIVSFVFLFLCLPQIFSLFLPKNILCNQSIPLPSIDSSITTNQNLSLTFCNLTFNINIHLNEHFFSRNISIDKSIKSSIKQNFTYFGHIIDEDRSSISLILYPQLQIYIYLNGTYYYYVSSSENSTIILKFSQRQLLQYYPQLVNDSLWNSLQQEEDIYQRNSIILHDLHFIYELLTLRCESDNFEYKTMSFCSLALILDELLYEKIFHSNIYYLFTFIEHYNFLLRTLTRNEYGGFLIERITLINHIETNFNVSLDLLHTLANNTNFQLKNYCLVHQMLLSDNEKDNYILGYQSSIHTYDIGGICSSPFSINNNASDEINLNTGLSIVNENLTKDLSLFFNGLMKTSYLFFRQMGLNLTLCSINATRRGFFQFNTDVSPVVQHCIDLVPVTLRSALKRRAHLCFNYINIYNSTNQTIQQQQQGICQQSIDSQSSVPIISGKHRKTPYIENALNNNRPGEWFEGNIVGMIITFSLIIWIPVSCFVHFCKDEINKKSLIEKQQQQQQHELETLPIKSVVIDQTSITKQTQTD
ncbi:unnamed protein product [Adineta steineri]|uniref:Uncharacterized protein n=1 Tax=Adineta steineri TaxID=433720 RepID=A0A815CR91_9BILA|nr:unnamed protein product [Adineta steineri]CAF1383280.1 unnamed protein product [Adineta steineri]